MPTVTIPIRRSRLRLFAFALIANGLLGVALVGIALSEAIGHDSRDIGAVRDSVRLLRDRVQQLARDAAASPDGRHVGPELTVLAYGLTLWLGVLALLSTAAGFVVLRI